MQFVKTLLIVAVLAAVTYGVYAALTGKSDVAPPPGAPTLDAASGAPQIELPSIDPQAPSGFPGVAGLPGGSNAPPAAVAAPSDAPSNLGEAPRYAPAPEADAGAAPPFVSPNVGPGEPAAPPTAVPTTNAPPFDAAAPAAATAIPPAAAAFDPTAAPPAGVPTNAAPPIAAAPADPNAPPAAAPPAAGDPSVAAAPPPAAGPTYQQDCATAQTMLEQHQLDQALLLMSRWYGDPTLSEQDQTALLGLLNQLAGTVIYSRENWLAEAYEVQPGDTLDRIAMRYNVPPQLLAKINGIADPTRPPVGEKLKVVKGPFDAVVDMRGRCLILKLQGRFAGRFPIGVGQEHAATDGEYQVQSKIPNPTYYSGEKVVAPEDPNNPLGKYWIELGNQVAIHGTNDPESLKRDDPRGCVRMHPRDIEDVYDMMTMESRVTIVR